MIIINNLRYYTPPINKASTMGTKTDIKILKHFCFVNTDNTDSAVWVFSMHN
jgi:hypothetical protein